MGLVFDPQHSEVGGENIKLFRELHKSFSSIYRFRSDTFSVDTTTLKSGCVKTFGVVVIVSSGKYAHGQRRPNKNGQSGPLTGRKYFIFHSSVKEIVGQLLRNHTSEVFELSQQRRLHYLPRGRRG